MRKILLAASMFAVLALGGRAVAFEDPRSLVDAIYAPFLRGAEPADLDQFYSTHLKELFAANASKIAAGTADSAASAEMAKPQGFNPFIDAQNSLLLDFTVSDPVIIGDQAVISVGFHNFDHPSLLSLALVKEADGWKVDDISALGQGENWMLSWLLLYDPWAVQ